jgi:hypothetical protein
MSIRLINHIRPGPKTTFSEITKLNLILKESS